MELDRIRAGDEDAFGRLVHELWRPLVRYLTTLAGRSDIAEDAAQEALVRLREHRERWEGGTARALLFRVARNVVLDQRRRAEVRARLQAEVAHDLAPSPDPAADLQGAEMGARILAAVARLPLRRREVFELVRLHGLNFGPLNAERLPAYHRLDVRVTRAFLFTRSRLEVFLDVFNLYDRTNLRGYDWGLRGTGGGAYSSYRDGGEEQLPIMPTLGFRWVF